MHRLAPPARVARTGEPPPERHRVVEGLMSVVLVVKPWLIAITDALNTKEALCLARSVKRALTPFSERSSGSGESSVTASVGDSKTTPCG